jgi:sugar-specific transcriptional regulator TrmB
MINIQKLQSQLEMYGLGDTEARIYIYLLRQSGELSVLQIARALKLGRTPVYNALGRLEQKNLVARTITENGHNYTSTSPDNLERYWHGKTIAMERLGSQLAPVINCLEGLTATHGYKSRVDYFTGRQGLEQITYNSLRAQSDLYIYEVATDMTVYARQDVAESFRQILVDRQITTHQLTNFTEFKDFTDVEEMVANFWDVRYIDPDILKINFEMLIYNDVCALYSIEGNDAFGVEIHNPNLAQMQKQIFKAMQHLAQPMTKEGSRGKVYLVGAK